MAVPPLLAAIDWLEAILPFLFLVFWVVSQIRNLFRGANAGRPQGPVVVRPVPRPPADDEQRREIARQVEEFLRRASGETEGANQPRPRPRPRGPAPRRVAAPPPLPGPTQRREGRVSRPAVAPVAEPVRPLGSLGGHGGDVARHVDDAFAHEMGRRLESDPESPAGAAAASPPATSTDLATLLRNPATLRQMLIVREVLDRPVDRW